MDSYVVEKGVNEDRGLHITLGLVPSSPSATGGTQGHGQLSLQGLYAHQTAQDIAQDGGGCSSGIQRRGHISITSLKASNLCGVTFFFTRQPHDSHVAPRWISMMTENAPAK